MFIPNMSNIYASIKILSRISQGALGRGPRVTSGGSWVWGRGAPSVQIVHLDLIWQKIDFSKNDLSLEERQKFRMGNLLMSGRDERLDHWQLFYWTLAAPKIRLLTNTLLTNSLLKNTFEEEKTLKALSKPAILSSSSSSSLSSSILSSSSSSGRLDVN